MLRLVTVNDAAAIAEIYNYYIENTIVTFEEVALTPAQMANRIDEVIPHFPWLVDERDGQVIGYAYVRPFHQRSAFRFTVENAVYIRHDLTGRGIGVGLLTELLAKLPHGIHSVIARLGLPNDPSVKIHEKFGFTPVGIMKEVGYKFGEWRDIGDWQLVIH